MESKEENLTELIAIRERYNAFLEGLSTILDIFSTQLNNDQLPQALDAVRCIVQTVHMAEHDPPIHD